LYVKIYVIYVNQALGLSHGLRPNAGQISLNKSLTATDRPSVLTDCYTRRRLWSRSVIAISCYMSDMRKLL